MKLFKNVSPSLNKETTSITTDLWICQCVQHLAHLEAAGSSPFWVSVLSSDQGN